VSDLDKKIEEAANDHKEIGGNQIFIEGAHFVRDLLAEENKRLKQENELLRSERPADYFNYYRRERDALKEQLSIAMKALYEISGQRDQDLDEPIANEAIAKIKEEGER
jgi:hypothetical protein